MAVRPEVPVRSAVGILAMLGLALGAKSLLAQELAAPRFSDSGINATRVAASDDPDLDGDGVADRFDGIFESCDGAGCAYHVYLRRPEGDVYAGRVAGFWPFRIDRIPGRPADIVAGATRYRFVDDAYRPLR